jgi:hypothetical protein
MSSLRFLYLVLLSPLVAIAAPAAERPPAEPSETAATPAGEDATASADSAAATRWARSATATESDAVATGVTGTTVDQTDLDAAPPEENVAPPSAPAAPAAREDVAQLARTLREDPDLEAVAERIILAPSGGSLLISGAVETEAQRERTVYLARKHTDLEVRNYLRISSVPTPGAAE